MSARKHAAADFAPLPRGGEGAAAPSLHDECFDRVRREVIRRLGERPGCHDFEHTERVLANALRLAAGTPGADVAVIRFAALLHDAARPEEEASRGRRCHAELGAELAAEILGACPELPPEFVAAVADAVRSHRYRGRGKAPATIEARIVFDADKLDSLGAVGVGRAFLFAGHCGARLHNRPEEALAGSPYGPEDTAYREYLVKLRKLPEAMLTEAGRAEARERADFMAEFFRRLDREVYG